MEPTLDNDPPRAAMLADVLKALAHPLRLRIVAALGARTWRVGDLATSLDVAPAILSQQLRLLRMSGLVTVERSGGGATYRLAEPHLRDLVACLDGCRRGFQPAASAAADESPNLYGDEPVA
jgi:DNA-binding transcriptional ArsR family regulator